jgi:endonuclease/exonuclease/phosphatase (EEP) superfamily protein YafD
MRSFARRAGLRNANDGKIFSATWNVWQPQRLLIDHAFLSRHWKLRKCSIGPDIGSDHRPLMVQATLQE